MIWSSNHLSLSCKLANFTQLSLPVSSQHSPPIRGHWSYYFWSLWQLWTWKKPGHASFDFPTSCWEVTLRNTLCRQQVNTRGCLVKSNKAFKPKSTAGMHPTTIKLVLNCGISRPLSLSQPYQRMTKLATGHHLSPLQDIPAIQHLLQHARKRKVKHQKKQLSKSHTRLWRMCQKAVPTPFISSPQDTFECKWLQRPTTLSEAHHGANLQATTNTYIELI